MLKYIAILVVLVSMNIASAQTIIGDNIVTDGSITSENSISNYSSSRTFGLVSDNINEYNGTHMFFEAINSSLYPTTTMLSSHQMRPLDPIPYQAMGFLSLSYHGNTIVGSSLKNFTRNPTQGINIDDTQAGGNDFARTLYTANGASLGTNTIVQYAFPNDPNNNQSWTVFFQLKDSYYWGFYNQSDDGGILHEFGFGKFPQGYGLDMEGNGIFNTNISFSNVNNVPCFNCSIPFSNITGFSDPDNYEPSIEFGQSNQFWIGNKTWQNISFYSGKDGLNGTNGMNGSNGVNGSNLTINISEQPDYSYFWNFSDGTSFRTSILRGINGSQGIPGINGTNATFNSSLDYPNSTVSNNLKNWNETNITQVRQSISNGSNLTYNSTTGIVDYIVPISVPESSYRTIVILNSDVRSIASTAFQNISGISFNATAGTPYRFYGMFLYNTSVATIGIKVSLVSNSPSSFLAYQTQTGISIVGGAGEGWQNNQFAYNSGVSSTASVSTNGNIITIEGMIILSSNGVVQFTFAPETTTANGVIIKKYSTLEYW